MSYTTDQLDAFWSRYVTVRPETVIALKINRWGLFLFLFLKSPEALEMVGRAYRSDPSHPK